MFSKTPVTGLVVGLLAALALPAAAQAATPKQQYYVSLGDSYAVGWQRFSTDEARVTNKGPADQVVPLARKKGYRLKLVNFGCAGATTTSILQTKGCATSARAINGPKYTSTQAAAAQKFLRNHRGKVALVTVSIGGNDVTSCASAADPGACVGAATESIKTNVTKLAKGLRKAGGKKVRIVGTTYPDVLLGAWVHPPVNQLLAQLSVGVFKGSMNPTLKAAYASANGKFADVTAATGAYGSLDEMTTLDPYGSIPKPVATICRISYFCQYGDIHLRTQGYKQIAKLIVRTLPKR